VGLNINSRVLINDKIIARNGITPASLNLSAGFSPEDIYRQLQYNYHKFFKMDILSKWAWIGVEVLLNCNDTLLYNGLNRDKIGIVLATAHGCLEADKRYSETIATIPSPALFVYTLPNIMLGEISIRHGFKGEQACLVSERFDSEEMHFWVNDLMEKRGMEACLAGWVDVTETKHELYLFWITKNGTGLPFSSSSMAQLLN